MQVLITGGAGFLGVRLARELIRLGQLTVVDANGQPRNEAISQLVLVDRAAPPTDLLANPKVMSIVGDMNALFEPAAKPLDRFGRGVNCVFHLAAAVSGECEADFDLGMRSNIDATRALLEYCRAVTQARLGGDQKAGIAPLFVFASSLAVFGNSPQQPLPAQIEDTTLPTPQNSYGIQKFICEQLVADYGRKGFVTARNVRLMTVSVRPGKPNGAASSFLSGMIREPLAGVAAVCPVAKETAVALSSPARTIEGLLKAAQVSDEQWGPRTAMNLPAISTTVGAMADSLMRIGGAQAHNLLTWTIDPAISKIVTSWPSTIVAKRANDLGLLPEPSFDQIVKDYILENEGQAS